MIARAIPIRLHLAQLPQARPDAAAGTPDGRRRLVGRVAQEPAQRVVEEARIVSLRQQPQRAGFKKVRAAKEGKPTGTVVATDRNGQRLEGQAAEGAVKAQATAAGRECQRPDGGVGLQGEGGHGTPANGAHAGACPAWPQRFGSGLEVQVQRIGLAQGAHVNHGVVIEPTAQREAEVAEIGLGERIAEAIAEGQEPPA